MHIAFWAHPYYDGSMDINSMDAEQLRAYIAEQQRKRVDAGRAGGLARAQRNSAAKLSRIGKAGAKKRWAEQKRTDPN